jgi:hypothetical protein
MFEHFNFLNEFLKDAYLTKYFNTSTNENRFEFDDLTTNELPVGDLRVTTGEDQNGTWEKKEWISTDGNSKMSFYTYTSTGTKVNEDKNLIKNKITEAVKNEDYETAAKLKKQLEGLTTPKEKTSKK